MELSRGLRGANPPFVHKTDSRGISSAVPQFNAAYMKLICTKSISIYIHYGCHKKGVQMCRKN